MGMGAVAVDINIDIRGRFMGEWVRMGESLLWMIVVRMIFSYILLSAIPKLPLPVHLFIFVPSASHLFPQHLPGRSISRSRRLETEAPGAKVWRIRPNCSSTPSPRRQGRQGGAMRPLMAGWWLLMLLSTNNHPKHWGKIRKNSRPNDHWGWLGQSRVLTPRTQTSISLISPHGTSNAMAGSMAGAVTMASSSTSSGHLYCDRICGWQSGTVL